MVQSATHSVTSQDSKNSDGFIPVKGKQRKKRTYEDAPAQVGMNYRPRFPTDDPKFKDAADHHFACYNHAWNASVEEAEQAVMAVLNLIFKNPLQVQNTIISALERRKGKGFLESTNIMSFSIGTIVLPNGYIEKYPDYSQVGIPIDQVLIKYHNPRLGEIKGVCYRIQRSMMKMISTITGVERTYGILCTAKKNSPVRVKTNIEDYQMDMVHIELNFGAAGLDQNKAQRYIQSKKPKNYHY
jgi:hypothetical protein